MTFDDLWGHILLYKNVGLYSVSININVHKKRFINSELLVKITDFFLKFEASSEYVNIKFCIFFVLSLFCTRNFFFILLKNTQYLNAISLPRMHKIQCLLRMLVITWFTSTVLSFTQPTTELNDVVEDTDSRQP